MTFTRTGITLLFLFMTALSTPPGGENAWEITFSDEFDNQSQIFDIEANGNANWIGKWHKFNVRALDGNSDKGFKVFDEEKFGGMTQSFGSALKATNLWGNRDRYLHEASNGTIKLRAYPTPPGISEHIWGYSHLASMISTELSHSQTYGYWEARFRINSISKGQHFAIWLLPKDGSWPPEIDMLEVLTGGGVDNKFTANSHGNPNYPGFKVFEPPNGYLGWHTFGFEWTKEDMRWFVDGKEVVYSKNYINKPMYFLASWEIAGNWPGLPNASTVWPAQVEFDYVRIYKQSSNPIAINNTGKKTPYNSNAVSVSQNSNRVIFTFSYNVESGEILDIVNAKGEIVQKQNISGYNNEVTLSTKKLSRGVYFARLNKQPSVLKRFVVLK